MFEEEIAIEKQEQIERGKRIKNIRENELKLKKTELGRIIGVSSQFLGLVEDGKGNLMYRSIKKLRDVSGHSSDYILYGLDDNVISETRNLLQSFRDSEILAYIETIKEITTAIKYKQV